MKLHSLNSKALVRLRFLITEKARDSLALFAALLSRLCLRLPKTRIIVGCFVDLTISEMKKNFCHTEKSIIDVLIQMKTQPTGLNLSTNTFLLLDINLDARKRIQIGLKFPTLIELFNAKNIPDEINFTV